MARTSRPFAAQFDSDCGGGDFIAEDDDIVMWDGVAYHVECAIDSGATVPGENDDERPARRSDGLRDPYA